MRKDETGSLIESTKDSYTPPPDLIIALSTVNISLLLPFPYIITKPLEKRV